MTFLDLFFLSSIVYITYKVYFFFRKKILLQRHQLLFDKTAWRLGKYWSMYHTSLDVLASLGVSETCYDLPYEFEIFSWVDRQIISDFLWKLKSEKQKQFHERTQEILNAFKRKISLPNTVPVDIMEEFMSNKSSIEEFESSLEEYYKSERN